MKNKVFWICVLSVFLLVISGNCLAVNSKLTRHSAASDFVKGKTENIVISSEGNLSLGRISKQLTEKFDGVWSINSIAVNGSGIFIGTSPNGGIYKYSKGKLEKIYPQEVKEDKKANGKKDSDEKENDPNKQTNGDKQEDCNDVEEDKHLLNEHIFAMAVDRKGNLIAGISGNNCRLIQIKDKDVKTIFEPEDANYIFAIAADSDGKMYIGTGPEGKVFSVDLNNNKSKLIYDSDDKNILSLAVDMNNYIYAGSDGRGIVYKIEPKNYKATVLYDCDQPEVTALTFDSNGNLYATATSAEVVSEQRRYAKKKASSGKPSSSSTDKRTAKNVESLKLEIANTKRELENGKSSGKGQPRKPSKSGKSSCVYKIDNDGFVTTVFEESVVLFSMVNQEENLIIGSGNDAKVYCVDVNQEEDMMVYEDETSSQVTAVASSGDDIYIGTANPAKLIKLGKGFSLTGSYCSELIDSEQPSKWGKLQIDAEIPEDCEVKVCARSGNIGDINDPTFSEWTKEVKITEPVQLTCPMGRFCQYKLIFNSKKGQNSPVVNEVAVASTVPNLAPKIESVEVSRDNPPGQNGFFKVSTKAKDDNGDSLIYKIDFKKTDWKVWIEIEDKYEDENFLWDSKTVEDGRYEIKVTASDERNNTTTTKLTGNRVSDIVVVDNSGPKVECVFSKEKIFEVKVSDELSAIGSVEYTIDGNSEWISLVPEDSVYDTTVEDFRILMEDDIKTGEHVMSLKASDAVGNVTYRNLKFEY